MKYDWNKIYEEMEESSMVGKGYLERFYQDKKTYMDMTMLKSALTSGVLTAILAGAVFILGKGSVFGLDMHALINVVAMALLTTIVSLIKQMGTTEAGNFMGVVSVK